MKLFRSFRPSLAFYESGVVDTWRMNIRKAVEIRTPEMKRDNGYAIPATYNTILQRHPQGVGRGGGAFPGGLTSPPSE